MGNTQLFNYNESENQVFLLYSACNVPINLASHTWLVCNEKGRLSRYEVRHFKSHNPKHGYIHLNTISYFQGIELFRFYPEIKWKTKLIRQIEDPAATKMIQVIKSSIKNYPYKDNYKFLGENSNTYTQWILNHFPELEIKLPWNSFGKRNNL